MIKKFKIFESSEEDIMKLYDFCSKNFDFKNFKVGREYFYQSITSCVIDSVFSIGISYEQTRRAVERYNEYYGLKLFRDTKDYPPIGEQDSLTLFIERTEGLGVDKMSTEVYKNRCRTSTHGVSLLKSEAALRFAKVLTDFEVDYFQDLKPVVGNEELERRIREIPGQRTGISLDYFFMLAGDETFVKVDRMMMRFMNDVIGYVPNKYEIRKMIIEVCKMLGDISPRTLDHQIWLYQRVK